MQGRLYTYYTHTVSTACTYICTYELAKHLHCKCVRMYIPFDSTLLNVEACKKYTKSTGVYSHTNMQIHTYERTYVHTYVCITVCVSENDQVTPECMLVVMLESFLTMSLMSSRSVPDAREHCSRNCFLNRETYKYAYTCVSTCIHTYIRS